MDLTLHIGTGKTGTSSIQALLRENRERLAEAGCLYPVTPGLTRHTRFGLFLKQDDELDDMIAWGRQNYSDPARFRKAFRRKLIAEISDAGLSRVLISDEALYASTPDALGRLRRFTNRIAGNVRVVVYLRRQDDHLASRYQQVVKVGETRRLAERTQQLTFTGVYDYHTRLTSWQQLMEPRELVVRRFERDHFVDGSLYQDFLDAAGLDLRADELTQVEPQNESLDAEAVEFLRLLNLYRVEHEGAQPGRINNRPLVKRLAEGSTGPTLTLPGPVLDEFMSRWEASNRAVAREFLGDGEELFRAPRKSSRTTTDQVLDPRRMDHFLELLELPEQTHAPLRALAEQEAVRAG